MASTGEAVLVDVDRTPDVVVVSKQQRSSRVVPALVALVPVVLMLAATRGQLGISYDSVMYSSTWRHLQAGGGWDFPSIQPPGLQLLIVLAGGPLSPLLWWLNAAAAWGSSLLIFATAVRVTGSRSVGYAVASWWGLSLGTAQIHSMLWSEPLFCLAVNAGVFALVHVWERGVRGWPVGLLVVAVNVASVTRYMGVALVAVAGCLLLAAGWRTRGVRGVLVGAVVGGICSAGLVGVLVWHYLTGMPLTGPRSASPFTPGEVILQGPDAMVAFLVNREHVIPPPVAALVVFGLLVLVGAAWRQMDRRMVPVASWAGGYLLVLWLSSIGSNVNAFDFRLLLPAMPAIATLVAAVVWQLGGRRALWPTVAYLAFVAAGTVLWVPQGATSHLDYPPPTRSAPGLAATLDRYVSDDAVIVTNDPSHLIWHTGRDLVWRFPDAGPYPPHQPRSGDVAVWFHDTPFMPADEGQEFSELVVDRDRYEVRRIR